MNTPEELLKATAETEFIDQQIFGNSFTIDGYRLYPPSLTIHLESDPEKKEPPRIIRYAYTLAGGGSVSFDPGGVVMKRI